MKYLVLTVLVMVSSSFGELDRIAKINKLKKEAKEAYNSGNFDKAIDNYHYLLDTLQMEDDNITLNLANAYFQKKDTTNAFNNYESIINSENKSVRSVAHQQLGIMANRTKKYEEALEHFKQALKADPTNEEARYNYEMVKKALENQKDQNNQDQDKNDENKDQQDQKDQQDKDQKNQDKKDGDQENEDQQNQDQQSEDEKGQEKDQQEKDGKPDEKDKEGEEQKKGEKDDTKKEDADEKQQAGEENDKKEGDEENMSSVSEKLKEMKMSPEKAKMILEALKNKEIQYYQQNKHKATKPKSSGKPDW
ncbi:tetratricopeptide repeat protein [Fulvivirga maritima]|uniref:tetratricopeptide repeat protein n=1 Tax=Fulvivirga maritima TaxID=2904247 RepID=UPI001F3C0F69|nr:tetratricopeptide repeat protein [Fulvivirga maritima]UII26802.1 tetratricopeptide repeat protein [Fulvivirga maritima]